jgi:hypothetical protein
MEGSGRRERTVYRPNVGWVFVYSFLPLVGGIGVVLAVTTRDFSFTVTSMLSVGVFVGLVESPAFAYLSSVKIVADAESISKVYLFGLLRKRISLEDVRTLEVEEDGKAFTYSRVEFTSTADGGGFSVYPLWIWRSRDIDQLRTIASEGKGRPAAHPEWSGQKERDVRWTVLGSLVAILAVIIGFSNASDYHQATSVPDITAGWLAFIPVVGWFWVSNRMPRKPLVLWSARAATLALTIAIPMTIWIVLHGPPCPPNCGP